MSKTEKLIDITMQLHHETQRAVLVSDDGDESKAKWLPKSLIEIQPLKDGMVEITLPEWKAKMEGLI